MSDWKWTPSEQAFTKLGYLTSFQRDGKIVVDIYGSNPLEKDNQHLCREIANGFDSVADLTRQRDALAAACRKWIDHLTPGDSLYSPEETAIIGEMAAALALCPQS